MRPKTHELDVFGFDWLLTVTIINYETLETEVLHNGDDNSFLPGIFLYVYDLI